MIPYGRQDICEADIEAVLAVLKSDFLTQGPLVATFEQAVADYCGVQNAVAMNSATGALHIACLALGVKTGDVVWTSPISFVASANCALYCGATIDFVDIDPKTYNMSVRSLENKLSLITDSSQLPKVVIPVHLGGQPCDMAAIHALSKKYGFYVIEDASHAIGSRYFGKRVGNCCYSDITVFSFHPVKIITTGEGGMALTKDPVVANKMKQLRSHGITRDASEMTHAPDGLWYYQQICLGYNYRMDDVHAALGLSQLSRIEKFIEKRQSIASIYNKLFSNLPIFTPWQHEAGVSSFHLYIIRLDLDAFKHGEVFERLRANGVGVNLHYIPIYRHPYYARMGFKPDDFPEAERYYREAISLPIFPLLTEEQQREIASYLANPLGHQTIF